jgi:mRNA interferase HigB
MGMNVIAQSALQDFWARHPDSQEALKVWYKLLSNRDFADFIELKQTFSSADFVHSDYVIFEIKGNKYRVITRINFAYKTVWIKHVFTHAEYDRWSPEGASYEYY